MQTTPLSDLATSLRMRSGNAALKARLDRAATEMTTGIVSDTIAATGGRLDRLLNIERKLAALGEYEPAVSTATTRFGAAQASLSEIAGSAGTLAPQLLAAAGRSDVTAQARLAAAARAGLETAVAALNTRAAGQALFAGAATDGVAVDTASAILADVDAIVSSQPDASAAAAAVSTYFSDPLGGFRALRYLGSQQAGPKMKVGDAEVLPALPDATNAAVLSVLEGLAIAASVDSGAFATAPDQRSALLSAAGKILLASVGQMQNLRAGVGETEGRVARIKTGLTAKRHALELARNDILSVDQFEAASRFDALRGQLETGYMATVRISRLSLTDFLR